VVAGNAEVNHNHMDAGSFFLEMGGHRWVGEPGRRAYQDLESQGVDYWNKQQDSSRWQVMETNPRYHNTLQVGGALHRVDGGSRLVGFSERERFSVVDFAQTFGTRVSTARRGICLVNADEVVVRDELTGIAEGTEVVWTLMVQAEAECQHDGILLRFGDRNLHIRFETGMAYDLRVDSLDTEHPPEAVPVAGYNRIQITHTVCSSGSFDLTTRFLNHRAETPGKILSPAEWSTRGVRE
jgi:hypothetical protein